MYLAINEVYKEFSVVTRHFMIKIEDLQDAYCCSDIFYEDLDGDVDIDELTKQYRSKGYRQLAITDYADIIEFVLR